MLEWNWTKGQGAKLGSWYRVSGKYRNLNGEQTRIDLTMIQKVKYFRRMGEEFIMETSNKLAKWQNNNWAYRL